MFARGLVAIACLGLLFAMVSSVSGAEPREATPALEKWCLGIQTYTFNRFTLFEAIDKAGELGLKCIEAYPGQRLSPDQPDVKFSHDAPVSVLAQVKNKLDDAGIKLVNYGVVGLGKDEAANRKVFDFAKLMGIETIASEPEPGSFDLLDKLTAEYKINVAVHNHPAPSHYWDPKVVLEAIKGHSKRIGACADTGHWTRSGVKPIDALRMLEGRIISLHFKDLNEADRKAHDVPWGTGVCDVKGMLAELKRQGFSGVFSIEYEHNWENSMPEIAKCIEYFNQVRKELGQ